MVDLGGYVIILVETRDKKVKLYGKNRSRGYRNQYGKMVRDLGLRAQELSLKAL